MAECIRQKMHWQIRQTGLGGAPSIFINTELAIGLILETFVKGSYRFENGLWIYERRFINQTGTKYGKAVFSVRAVCRNFQDIESLVTAYPFCLCSILFMLHLVDLDRFWEYFNCFGKVCHCSPSSRVNGYCWKRDFVEFSNYKSVDLRVGIPQFATEINLTYFIEKVVWVSLFWASI